ncbi:uncharacterized protein LOC119267981 isoform X1 [Triticum dicoccoides]|uniref:uncharacterized protein LOC119267980 n=2 Tax=Triticum dicoccoides TaxID=85692 RepID=UPI0018907F19|nr:uncharacterized protein LOC119267980 [Triticum dicoccoides]XP_037405347.1 uncharacterized protein LOC119267980 [Triticum dicoccoides]XP_037405348.1 uncharacterized protein LOC119267980 [Triticum dicoccoides]XP_037405349.1 uncharacterized protein LOC119267981 isoform X1 [Triticum dicoccoides]XP_037405350.1 uncharacterized protein LOC119267981 isoform X1 [Triticum dicoccoides]XP_037405351.1 uncharacterized protein LOC119267981 isoform X1 [Triticum dicoccoides]
MLTLVRAPLRCLLLSSPPALSLCSPYMTVGHRSVGGGVSPLLLMLSTCPSAWRVGEGFPAAGAPSGASSRGRSFYAHPVSMDDEAPSSSAAGSVYDLAVRYLTVDEIANAANLDEISITSIYAHWEDVGLSISNAASSNLVMFIQKKK